MAKLIAFTLEVVCVIISLADWLTKHSINLVPPARRKEVEVTQIPASFHESHLPRNKKNNLNNSQFVGAVSGALFAAKAAPTITLIFPVY